MLTWCWSCRTSWWDLPSQIRWEVSAYPCPQPLSWWAQQTTTEGDSDHARLNRMHRPSVTSVKCWRVELWTAEQPTQLVWVCLQWHVVQPAEKAVH